MNNQRKPGWVTAVAIIAIVLSGFGAMGGIQEALSPIMFEQQKAQYEELINEFNKIIEQSSEYDDPANQQIVSYIQMVIDGFEKIINMPDWYKTWMVISGILQLLINGFYLFAAIWLLQMKPHAISFLYIALPLSITLGITRVYLANMAFASTGLWLMGGSIIAIMIEIILLLVLISADKKPFRQFEA